VAVVIMAVVLMAMMLLAVMRVIMVMIVAVVMVVVMIMVIMMMPMLVIMGCRRNIGLERRLDRSSFRAALLEQGFDRRTVPDAQAIGEHLHRHVTVAERPGEARERRRIGQACLDQRLRRGDNLHHAPVIEQERIVGPQRRRLLEGELDAGPLAGEDEALLPAALLEIENERIGGRRRPHRAGAQDFCRERHEMSVS
jgi:hypothetical protein